MTVLRVFLLGFLFPPLVAFAQVNALDALDDFIRTQTRNLPGKVTYTISPISNSRACDAFEPFIPPGNKLWGKATIGIRCLAPQPWTIYLQVTVSSTGNYLVSTRNISAGTQLSAGDVVVRSGELTAFPINILVDASQVAGKMLKNGISIGQPIRADLLVAPWAVQQGQTVRMHSSGQGFSVTSEGKALNNANEGQIVQVRTSNGQTVSGIARNGGIVDISH